MKFFLFYLSLFCSFAQAGRVSLYLQNDILHPIKTDKYYTHGTKYEAIGREWGWTLGQYLYTPEDLSAKAPFSQDRPYCGWLYAGILREKIKGNVFDFFELQAGAIGKYSYAEQAQTLVHRWTESATPLGWESQIGNEPGVNFFYQRKYKIETIRKTLDVIPQFGGGFGSVYSGLNIGLGCRIGVNLPKDLTDKSIEPTSLNLEHSQGYFYLFLKLNERVVFHNVTLDGSLFQNSPHTVRSQVLVSDLEYGLCFGVSRFDLKFSLFSRTREYMQQPLPQNFGGITFTVRQN